MDPYTVLHGMIIFTNLGVRIDEIKSETEYSISIPERYRLSSKVIKIYDDEMSKLIKRGLKIHTLTVYLKNKMQLCQDFCNLYVLNVNIRREFFGEDKLDALIHFYSNIRKNEEWGYKDIIDDIDFFEPMVEDLKYNRIDGVFLDDEEMYIKDDESNNTITDEDYYNSDLYKHRKFLYGYEDWKRRQKGSDNNEK